MMDVYSEPLRFDVTMADVHDSAVAQQHLYEHKVLFFLSPEDYFPPVEVEKRPTANVKPETRQSKSRSPEKRPTSMTPTGRAALVSMSVSNTSSTSSAARKAALIRSKGTNAKGAAQRDSGTGTRKPEASTRALAQREGAARLASRSMARDALMAATASTANVSRVGAGQSAAAKQRANSLQSRGLSVQRQHASSANLGKLDAPSMKRVTSAPPTKKPMENSSTGASQGSTGPRGGSRTSPAEASTARLASASRSFKSASPARGGSTTARAKTQREHANSFSGESGGSPGGRKDGDDGADVLLYRPRPTLKELAQRGSAKRPARGSPQRKASTTSCPTGDRSELPIPVAKDSERSRRESDNVMARFAEQERRFRDSFQLAAENILLHRQHSGGKEPTGTGPTTSAKRTPTNSAPPTPKRSVSVQSMASSNGTVKSKLSPTPSRRPRTHSGFWQLENLEKLMRQLSTLQRDNAGLRRRCSFLQDTKDILRVQYQTTQTQNAAHSTHGAHPKPGSGKVHRGSLLSKAGKQVMHYLSNPSTPIAQVTSPALTRGHQRVHSTGSAYTPDVAGDVTNSAYTTDVIMDKPRTNSMARSSSFGSIDDLDIRERRSIALESSEHYEQVDINKSINTPQRKKTNKRFAPKWSKMKRVFSKPESTSKTDSSAVTAEEIVRMNNKSQSERGRPTSMSNSRSFDHGELSSPWMVSDKLLLGVEPTKQSPSSPSSVQSESGSSAFQATTSTTLPDHEYAEIGPPTSTTPAYVSMDGSQQLKKLNATYSTASSDVPTRSATIRKTSSFADKDGLLAEEPQSFSDHEPAGKGSGTGERALERCSSGLVRRKSSPNLSVSSLTDAHGGFLEGAQESAFKRSASYKDKSSNRAMERRLAEQEAQLTRARAAWVKVKDMIHTRRRESLHTPPRRWHPQTGRGRTASFGDDVSPEGSSWEQGGQAAGLSDEAEYEAIDNYTLEPRELTPPHGVSRSNTMKATSYSPPARHKRTRSMKVSSQQPAPPRSTAPPPLSPPPPPPPPTSSAAKKISVVLPWAASPVDVSALMGGMSDEFSRKMLEWEDKKRRGGSVKESGDDGSTKFTEDFIRRMEQWERMKGIQDASSLSPPRPRDCPVVASCSPPRPTSPPSEPKQTPVAPAQEQVAEHLSESFSRTVQEWERLKERRVKKTPDPPARGRLARQPERRSKSGDRQPREKSRQRYEREIHKREQKLEKERQKLEKMKQRLEHSDGRESLPLDFFKKLQEWDVLRGLRIEGSGGGCNSGREGGGTGQGRQDLFSEHRGEGGGEAGRGTGAGSRTDDLHLQAQHSPRRSRSEKLQRELNTSGQRDRLLSDSACANNSTRSDTREDTSRSFEDDSTSIDLSLTMETIALLEDTNEKLSSELSEREEDLSCLQDAMTQLTDRMNALDRDYSQQIADYKRELWASSRWGQEALGVESVNTSIKQLKHKLNTLQEFGERVLEEKRQAESEGLSQLRLRVAREETLLEQIERLQQSLDRQAYVRGTEVFDRLYQYLHNVQKQVWNLKEGIIERNAVIEQLQRHLLAQQVAHCLLTSQIHARDTTLSYMRTQRRAGVLKRWKTFHGNDFILRQDGSVVLRRRPEHSLTSDKDLSEFSNVITRATHLLSSPEHLLAGGGVKGHEEALALHFDWLDGIRQQIQEVQEGQQCDQYTQARPEAHSRECQTLLTVPGGSLTAPPPLARLRWDGTVQPVIDRGLQVSPPTADAAVYIEDLEVYDLKQRGKWRRRKKSRDEAAPSPLRGAVLRKMEMFETARELRAHRKIAAATLSRGSSGEDADNRTVIGKKILDYELMETERTGMSGGEAEEGEVNDGGGVLSGSEGAESTGADVMVGDTGPARYLVANRGRSINQRDSSTSPDEMLDSHFAFPPRISDLTTPGASVNAIFTISLSSDSLKEHVILTPVDDSKTVASPFDPGAVVETVEAVVSAPCSTELQFKADNKPQSSQLPQAKTAETKASSNPSLATVSDPIVRPKRRSKRISSRSGRRSSRNPRPSGERGTPLGAQVPTLLLDGEVAFSDGNAELAATEDEAESLRDRAKSETSVLVSKYGLGAVEETGFSINVERYMLGNRRENWAKRIDTCVDSSAEQLIDNTGTVSQQVAFNSRPVRVSISALHSLKSADQLQNESDTTDGVPSRVSSPDSAAALLELRGSGLHTPQSLPSTSPPIRRRPSRTHDVTKRLSLPYINPTEALLGGAASPLDALYPRHSRYRFQGAAPFTAVKRKAFVLEPFTLEPRPPRPRSMVSESTDTGEDEAALQGAVEPASGGPATPDSIWRRFLRSRSPNKPRSKPRKVVAVPKQFARLLGGRKEPAGAPEPTSESLSAVRQLCMQALFVDTAAARTSQSLPVSGSALPDHCPEEAEPGTSGDDLTPKKKNRKLFLDAKWLARPRKLFKTSSASKSGRS